MWTYRKTEIISIEQIPEKAIGFVYRIVDENGKDYIGCKSLYSKRKKHFGKKKLAEVTDARKKTYETIVKESNWLSYTGSNKELNEAIANGMKISKEILRFCFSKKQLSYFEIKFMMIAGVIEPGNNSYNQNLMARYFRKDLL